MNRFYQARTNILVNKPQPETSSAFEAMYREISSNWEEKAERLQQRRWQYIKFN